MQEFRHLNREILGLHFDDSYATFCSMSSLETWFSVVDSCCSVLPCIISKPPPTDPAAMATTCDIAYYKSGRQFEENCYESDLADDQYDYI
jgi:hypothetical protein